MFLLIPSRWFTALPQQTMYTRLTGVSKLYSDDRTEAWDANQKPEIIRALTPFWGLNGFRTPAVATGLLMPVCPPVPVDACNDLKTQPVSFALQRLFEAMMALRGKKRKAFSPGVIPTTSELKYRSPGSRNVEILLCTEGKGRIKETGGDTGLTVKKGDSFLVPASIAAYVIRGNFVL